MDDDNNFISYLLDRINVEIPSYLDKFSTFEQFDKAMPGACASGRWKILAYAMASVKWNVKIKHIPR
jgi:hypothetical protein